MKSTQTGFLKRKQGFPERPPLGIIEIAVFLSRNYGKSANGPLLCFQGIPQGVHRFCCGKIDASDLIRGTRDAAQSGYGVEQSRYQTEDYNGIADDQLLDNSRL
jgi:hypothetical protein